MICEECSASSFNICALHARTDNLSDGSELREAGFRILSLRLMRALEVHSHCPVCVGEVRLGREELLRLEAIPR